MVNTRLGVERVRPVRLRLAATRPRQAPDPGAQDNVLTFAGDLWQRTVDEVAPEFPT